MREIKFRAKGVDGKWWYGSASPDTAHFRNVNLATFFSNLHAGALLPETLGEFTGLKDKNDKEIYEGDIVRMYQHSIEDYPLYQRVGMVEFSEDRFMCWRAIPHHFYLNGHLRDIPKSSYEVIGNIYENPELLEQK